MKHNSDSDGIITPAKSLLIEESREIRGLALARFDSFQQLQSISTSFKLHDVNGTVYHISVDLFNGKYPLSHTVAIRKSGVFFVATDFLLYRQKERHFFLTSADRLRIPNHPEPRGERITDLCRVVFTDPYSSIFSLNPFS